MKTTYILLLFLTTLACKSPQATPPTITETMESATLATPPPIFLVDSFLLLKKQMEGPNLKISFSSAKGIRHQIDSATAPVYKILNSKLDELVAGFKKNTSQEMNEATPDMKTSTKFVNIFIRKAQSDLPFRSFSISTEVDFPGAGNMYPYTNELLLSITPDGETKLADVYAVSDDFWSTVLPLFKEALLETDMVLAENVEDLGIAEIANYKSFLVARSQLLFNYNLIDLGGEEIEDIQIAIDHRALAPYSQMK